MAETDNKGTDNKETDNKETENKKAEHKEENLKNNEPLKSTESASSAAGPRTESDFLKEKIKERPVNKRKLLKRTMITAGLAVVFGLVACVTFSLLEPVISNTINPEETAETVTFPEETQEVNPKDMAVDDKQLHIKQEEASEDSSGAKVETDQETGTQPSAETQTESQTDASQTAESQTQDVSAGSSDAQAGYSSSAALSNFSSLYDSLGKLKEEAGKFMVTVTSVKSDTSWINDTLMNKNETSGLIVANNGRELLILVNYGNLQDADSIIVTFFTNEQAKATVKEVDTITGLAILSVDQTTLDKEIMKRIAIAPLGSSMGQGAVGQPVIAVGAPAGTGNSVYYGMVTSQDVSLGLADSDYKLLTTDIYGSSKASGALVNLNSQIIGVIYNGYHNTDMPNQLSAIGISELKKTIEKLSNGQALAYLGVHGAEVNGEVRAEYKMPYGAYVTSIDMDSPAMKAGIQSGDIITKCNHDEIVSYSELAADLMNMDVGEQVELTIKRQGQGNAYQQMTINVTMAAQPKS